MLYCYRNCLLVSRSYRKGNLLLQKNIALSIEINDENGLAASYGNLAIIFDENKDFENALQYYNSALVILKKKKR